jgi:hypothetical protein
MPSTAHLCWGCPPSPAAVAGVPAEAICCVCLERYFPDIHSSILAYALSATSSHVDIRSRLTGLLIWLCHAHSCHLLSCAVLTLLCPGLCSWVPAFCARL